jgi:hypothetical protein
MHGDDALVTDATDPRQQEFARRKERDRELAERARWRHQLSTKEGREFLWVEIFGACGMFAHIAPDQVEALGVRNRALRWWAFVTSHPQLFLQMQNEALERERKERREFAAQRQYEESSKRSTD